jgi:peptidyl-prolyl cis-trans isomerase C
MEARRDTSIIRRMTIRTYFKVSLATSLWLLVFFLTACKQTGSTQTTSPESSPSPPSASDTTIDPSLTITPSLLVTISPDTPLAATVNGMGITLAEYQIELALAQAVSGTGITTYTGEGVITDLIQQTLLAQAAGEAGFTVDESLFQAHIDQMGKSEEELRDWMNAYGYTEDIFRQSFARSIAAAWMRDEIIAQVPGTTEQVHARQILLYNSTEADNIYTQLQAGADFGTLAAQYEPLTYGDLGWFPRGYLTVPELDEIIFSLEPGEYSPVIETSLGYHIIQVLEYNPQYPLSPSARQVLQVRELQQWLENQWAQSEIEVHLP